MDFKKLLTVREVTALTGRSRTSIYYDIKAGRFPQPIKTGARSVRWISDEIHGWLDQCRSERGSVGAN